MNPQFDILYTRSYHKSVNKLTKEEQQLCGQAIEQFRRDPRHSGLNFEYLGKQPAHNHHSIRASIELRIILGGEPNMHDLQRVVLAFAGHHDSAYDWSHSRNHYTDISEGAPLAGDDLSADEFARLLEALNGAEEWQLFLHTDQEALVHKKFFREARILGAAGTGKTVLAFHRAAWLGNRHPKSKILFTTFSRSLTNHYERLYRRLPNAPSNVEFINIDKLAHQIAGHPVIDIKKSDELFGDAWDETVPGTALERLPRSYLKEEVERVIKGRGASREEYIDTGRFNRLGRRRGFNRGHREICWRLKDAWDARLRQAGITTFADVMIEARDIARNQVVGHYQSVIADEYQDFTLVGAQFVRALAAGAPDKTVPDDGLLLLGDAAQRIYAGGWIPAWAGLSFHGRSETIHTNYRNTRLIVEAASAVRGEDKTGAGDDEYITGYKAFALGDGARPVFFQVADKAREILAVKREIERLVNGDSVSHEKIPHEDIGVLVYHNQDADEIFQALKESSIPCVLLRALKNENPIEGVRVGTYDRGKGMEFQAVFLPRLGESRFPKPFDRAEPVQETMLEPDPDGGMSDEEKEHRQLHLDRLYVGMTRARRFLCLLADETPCKELLAAEDFFDWRHP